MGQILSRRVDGKLQLMALDLNTVDSKTGEAQQAAYKQSIEEAIKLMESAGLVDERAAELLRRFMPTCACNDRAANGRKGARLVLGLADGDDDPTCAEHALVNILEEGRKAMDAVLRELMNITEAQAEGDAEKIKAMRTCVGWFSSPVCALIYQKSPSTSPCARPRATPSAASFSSGWRRGLPTSTTSRRSSATPRRLGGCARHLRVSHVRLLSGCGANRAALVAGGLAAHLPPGGGRHGRRKWRQAAGLDPEGRVVDVHGGCAGDGTHLRLRLLEDDPRRQAKCREACVLDVLPHVWPAAHSFFELAAASPSAIVDGSLQMELGLELAPVAETASQAKRSARGAIDMARIRAAATSDPVVERLLAAAFAAMAKATANHAAPEWLPAGLVATDDSVTSEGKLSLGSYHPRASSQV